MRRASRSDIPDLSQNGPERLCRPGAGRTLFSGANADESPRVPDPRPAHRLGGWCLSADRGPEATRAARNVADEREPCRLAGAAHRRAVPSTGRRVGRPRPPQPCFAVAQGAQTGCDGRTASGCTPAGLPVTGRAGRARPRDVRAAGRGRTRCARGGEPRCSRRVPARCRDSVERAAAFGPRVRSDHASGGRARSGSRRSLHWADSSRSSPSWRRSPSRTRFGNGSARS